MYAAPSDAELRENRAHSDELQCDIGHGGDDAGERNGDLQRAVAVAVTHEIGGRHVSVTAGDAPKSHQNDQRDWIGDRRIRNREESQRPTP